MTQPPQRATRDAVPPFFAGDAYYFGTWQRAGHYWWNPHMRNERQTAGSRIDGRFNPSEREGEAALHHLGGWTIIAFANRTDDKRPGSNSAFCFRGALTFEEALAEARRVFPQVVERFAFEITDTAA